MSEDSETLCYLPVYCYQMIIVINIVIIIIIIIDNKITHY